MKFTIYKISTGQVLFSGECDAPDLLARDDRAVFVGEAFGPGYITGGRHTPLSVSPSLHHKFDYTVKQWVDTRDKAYYEREARARRQTLISASDWTQLPDVLIATKEAWATYRQALRDITTQPGFPFDIVWPAPPTQP